MSIKVNLTATERFVSSNEIAYLKPAILEAHKMLHEKSGPGNDYLGWVDLPNNIDTEEIKKINNAAKEIQNNSDVLVVVGIGGSYLGARAAIEALSHSFFNLMPKEKRNYPQIIFAGNSISSTYLFDLFEFLEGKEISINVISKSGTTTEPALAFRVLKEYMENKYGKDEAKNRIFATTDAKKGALKTLADSEGYTTFVIPDDVGGRYSILTPVGLLPIATSGIDIEEMLKGAKDGYSEYMTEAFESNECYKYAAIRNALYRKGKTTEIMVNYEPALHFVNEWWKQLYGESEGKDQKGIFPAAVDFSTDLHSMGQYIQDGLRNIFETVLNISSPQKDIAIKAEKNDLDGLNYLEGKTVDYVNSKAMEGTLKAHVSGNVPNIVIDIPKLTPYHFGKLIYFFEKACGISGYVLGVNPFDQPGVEEYKKNMFELLGKPGY